MKTKNTLLALAILITSLSFGQSNTFPVTGNVGIGTTNPQSKLDIDFGGEPKTIKFLEYANVSSSMNSLMRFTWYNDTADFGMVRSENTPIEALAIRFNNLEKIRFMPNGNVGIGISSPQAKLHIFNGDNSYGAILANSDETPFSLYTKTLSSQPTWSETFRIGLKYNTDENNGYISFYRGNSSAGGFLGFSSNGIERMRIVTNGNVGIGSANPDEKLTVNGTIHATEVKVTQTVPADYVFQKYYTGKSNLKSDYVMPTLAEIESFTKKNHHLPNVQSAQEVQQNGVSLGEMSNVLLQKVEELTLYAIEQNKELERLKTENNIQSKEIKTLKKENEMFIYLSKRLTEIENQLK